MKVKTPIVTTSDAERWLSPDIFIYKGKQYEVDIRGKVKLLKVKTNG
jgi:hypothetical protein